MSKAKRNFLICLILQVAALAVGIVFAANHFEPDWIAIALLIYAFSLGPGLLFLTGKDWLEELQFEGESGRGARVLRAILGAPIGCGGFVVMLAGVALIVFSIWAAIDEAEDWGWTKVLITLPIWIGLIVCGWYFIRLAMNRSGKPTRRELREQLREALGAPDWEIFEFYLRRPIPVPLRELYTGTDRLLGDVRLEGGEGMIDFQPINEDSLVDLILTVGGEFDGVPFAINREGRVIYLRPGEAETDGVFLARPGNPEAPEILAHSVDEFVERLRWEE